jgi:hypothetical protein
MRYLLPSPSLADVQTPETLLRLLIRQHREIALALAQPVPTNWEDLTDGGETALHIHDARYYTESEITTLLAGYSLVGHTHDDRYYTESEVDTLLGGKSDVGHTHDDRYYTESEITTLLGGKSDVGHTHDDRYYTESEITTLLSGYVKLAPASEQVIVGASTSADLVLRGPNAGGGSPGDSIGLVWRTNYGGADDHDWRMYADATGSGTSTFYVVHDGAIRFYVPSGGTYAALRSYSASETRLILETSGGNNRGSLYATDNYCGLLDASGNWRLNVNADYIRVYKPIIPDTDGVHDLGHPSYGFYRAILRHASNPHVLLNKTGATARTGYLEISGDDLRLYMSAVRLAITDGGASTYDVPTGQSHLFKVNAVEEFRIDGSGVKASGYRSSDGSSGITQVGLVLSGVTSIDIKDGLIVGYA